MELYVVMADLAAFLVCVAVIVYIGVKARHGRWK